MIDWITPWFNSLASMLLPIGIAVIVLYLVDTRCKTIPAAYRSWMWRLFFAKCLLATILPWCSGIPQLPSVPSLTDVASFAKQPTEQTPTDLTISSSFTQSRPTSNEASSDAVRDVNAAPPTPQHSLSWNWRVSDREGILAFVFSVWLSCVLVQFSILIRNYARMVASMRRDSRAANSALLALYRSVAVRLGVRKPPRVRLSDHASGPALLYCGAVKIVLPTKFHERFGDQACGMAFAHELAHFTRRDLFWNLLATIVSVTFFFYPPIWIALRRYRITMETACDAVAVTAAKVDRPTYARLLVELLETPPHRTSPAILTMARSGSYYSLTERLNEMKTSRPSRHSRLITFGATTALTALLLAPWGTADEPTSSTSRKTTTKQSSSSSGSSNASASGSASAGGFASGGSGGFAGGGGTSSASVTIGGEKPSSDKPQSSSADRYNKKSETRSSSSSSSSSFSSGITGGSNTPTSRSESRSNSDKTSKTYKTADGDIRVSKSTNTVDGNRTSTTQIASKRETIAILESDEAGVEVKILKRGQKLRDAKVYYADTMDEFAEQHPAIYDSFKKYLGTSTIEAATATPADADPAKNLMREHLQKMLEQANGNPQLEDAIRQMMEENQ